MPAYLLIPYVLIEALAYWAIASWIGWGWALLALVAAFFLGLILASVEFRAILRRSLEGRDTPGRTLADSGLAIVGSVLMILPGFITAILGLLLLIPPTRGVIRRMIGKRLRAWLDRTARESFVRIGNFGATRGFGPAGTSRPPVIDAEPEPDIDFTDVTPEDITGPRDGGEPGGDRPAR